MRARFEELNDIELPVNLVRDDALYIEFYSAWDYSLKFESLNHETTAGDYKILSVKEEVRERNDSITKRYKVAVMIRPGGVSTFITKVRQYMDGLTKKGNPKNEFLVANIESIELATLESLWTDEPFNPFPAHNEYVWWEVWFRKTETNDQSIERVTQNLTSLEVQIGAQTLQFPEHTIKLVKGTAAQLSSSLLLLDNLAELRKPQQLNDFITNRRISFQEKQEWMDDVRSRTNISIGQNALSSVCWILA